MTILEKRDQIDNKIQKTKRFMADNNIEIKILGMCDDLSAVKEAKHQQVIFERELERLMKERFKLSSELRRGL